MKTPATKLRVLVLLSAVAALTAAGAVLLQRSSTPGADGQGLSTFARVTYAKVTRVTRVLAALERIVHYQHRLEIVATRDNVIARIAVRQLGVGESPPGSNVTKYGDPGQPWCASFLTWVWRRAGVRIPPLAFSGSIYTWARHHAGVYRPTTRPQPGWAVLIGTGPEDPGTSLHVGLVAGVLPDGKIKIVNGNLSDQVKATGPCAPSNVRGGCEEPGSIYAYAAPNAPVPIPRLTPAVATP